jgi:hypothetical protein
LRPAANAASQSISMLIIAPTHRSNSFTDWFSTRLSSGLSEKHLARFEINIFGCVID